MENFAADLNSPDAGYEFEVFTSSIAPCTLTYSQVERDDTGPLANPHASISTAATNINATHWKFTPADVTL